MRPPPNKALVRTFATLRFVHAAQLGRSAAKARPNLRAATSHETQRVY